MDSQTGREDDAYADGMRSDVWQDFSLLELSKEGFTIEASRISVFQLQTCDASWVLVANTNKVNIVEPSQ